MGVRALLLVCCLSLAATAESDPYATWWRSADAALAGGAAVQLAPPPVAAGGEALAHHRVLLAWLAGDASDRARLGGLLTALRSATAQAVRVLDPTTPLATVPTAGTAAWQPEILGGPEAWQAYVAQQVEADRLASAPWTWRDRELAWQIDPVGAAARSGADQPPPPVDADERALVRFAAALLAAEPDPADRLYVSAPAQVFRYRVRRDCAAPWWPVADRLSSNLDAFSTPRAGITATGRDLLLLADAAAARPAMVRLILPAFSLWAQRCATTMVKLVRSDDPLLGCALLARCADDPAAARREIAAVRRHLEDFVAALPEDGPPLEPEEAAEVPITLRSGTRDLAAALAQVSTALAGLAGANHAVGRPLADWRALDVALATARLDACAERISEADALLADVAIGPAVDLVCPTLGDLYGTIEAMREALSAQARAVQQPGPRSAHARSLALERLADAYAAWYSGLPQLARILAGAGADTVPLPPLHLGLGEGQVACPAGWVDEAQRDDQALLQACPADPARSVATRLIALRQAGTPAAGLAGAWQRIQRRYAAYRILADADRPDLALIAAGMAPVSAALIAAARTGAAPAPEDAVRAWLAAAARPLPGRLSPPASDEPWLATEVLLAQAADLGGPWQTIARWIEEGGVQAGDRLTTVERLLRVQAADGPLLAAANLVAHWADGQRRPVVQAFAAGAAAGWTGGDRFLAIARTYLHHRDRSSR
jgi:hypothetical protein